MQIELSGKNFSTKGRKLVGKIFHSTTSCVPGEGRKFLPKKTYICICVKMLYTNMDFTASISAFMADEDAKT